MDREDLTARPHYRWLAGGLAALGLYLVIREIRSSEADWLFVGLLGVPILALFLVAILGRLPRLLMAPWRWEDRFERWLRRLFW